MDPDRARELLERERRRIMRGLGGLGPEQSDEPTTTDQHMADQASDLYDNELHEGLSDDLRADLAAVERAEARLAAGTYGRGAGAPRARSLGAIAPFHATDYGFPRLRRAGADLRSRHG